MAIVILAKWSISDEDLVRITKRFVNTKMIFTLMSIPDCIIHILILKFLYKSEIIVMDITFIMEKEKFVNFLPYLGTGVLRQLNSICYDITYSPKKVFFCISGTIFSINFQKWYSFHSTYKIRNRFS